MDENLELENTIKQVIIDTLNLEDYSVNDIKSQEPLFGEGLGLDSIDSLELGIAIKKKFNLKLDVDEDIKENFYSVEKLAQFIKSFNEA